MTECPRLEFSGNNLRVDDQVVLEDVPDNVLFSFPKAGAYIGAKATDSKSHHVFPIGKLEGRFMALFRFKLWWMTQRIGDSGADVPLETQFLLLETKPKSSGEGNDKPAVYTVFLPLLDGSFRACLQGKEDGQLEFCIESGDPSVLSGSFEKAVYFRQGYDPYTTISDAVRFVKEEMGTFRQREEKTLPPFVDYFGWCTWDAFYHDVTVDGINQGLKSLEDGGCPPGFLIIDDGWQSTNTTRPSEDGPATTFIERLFSIKANHKFQKERGTTLRPYVEGLAGGLKDIVQDIKSEFGLKHVYIWHAITGYWGGVHPASAGMEHHESALCFPVPCAGMKGNDPSLDTDDLVVQGLGLVPPGRAFAFYDELHTYLAESGIDGVKVDVQGIIETLGLNRGGRVAVAQAYHLALEASVQKNFPHNGIIACMSHSMDGLYQAQHTAVVRASDDFYPLDDASPTIHIASVAFNTMFLGEFMLPDWDMFHSRHVAGEFHAAARAIGGCPVYVSDKPGAHDFSVLKQLVLPDRTILRARLPGRPTRDCLFQDPARDGVSMLKIWNRNATGGVVGAFNCQGAGWCKDKRTNHVHDASPLAVRGCVRVADVEGLAALAGGGWGGGAAVWAHHARRMRRLAAGEGVELELRVREYEVFTVAPLKELPGGVWFAPVGLTDMFNAGGAVESVSYEDEGQVAMSVRGAGRLSMYVSQKPGTCTVDGEEVEVEYDSEECHAVVHLPVPTVDFYKWKVVLKY